MFTYGLGQRAVHQLITDGIYRWMRHPSYVGSTLTLLGLCVVARSWQMLVAEILAVVPLMAVRIQREEALLARSFGEEWTRYAARTPRFGI
jgi:protein-S-isoprenylcysteine O-methyltransferase Ste14